MLAGDLKKAGTMKSSFCQIQCNKSGAVRYDRMNGREYVVVPMVMIVEGVLNGSAGPVLYPAEELEKFPASWNHKPVVVYHPELNGQPLSACDPDILTVQGIGLIMNSSWEKEDGKKGKLKAEAWLEQARVEEVDERVAEAIKNNQTLELSTGLFFDAELQEGEFDGRHYKMIARNYRPDHLAVLPDKVGACSVEDGAGFLRANELPDTHFLTIKGRRLFQVKDANGEFDVALIQKAIDQIPSMEMEGVTDNQRAAMLARAKQMLRKAKKMAANARKEKYSFNTIRESLNAAIRNLGGKEMCGRWVVDVFPSTFVFEDNGSMFQQGYKMDGDVAVPTGLPTRVIRRYQYVEAANAKIVSNVQYEELIMTKDEMIAHLIKSGQWDDNDKEFLTAQNEEHLKYLVDKAGKAAPVKPEQLVADNKEAVANATKAGAAGVEPKAPQTVDEYIAAAPEGIREVLNHGLRAHKLAKETLIGKIMANKRNKFTKDQLEAKSLEDLEGMAALVAEDAPVENVTVANYAGQGEVVDNSAEEEPLPIPVMNFSSNQ